MAKSKSDGDEGCDEIPFEQSLEELEALVMRLEQGNLGLDQALADYESAIHRLRKCFRHLETAERKVEILRGVKAQGSAVTEAFDDAEFSMEEKQQLRSRRRSTQSDLDR